VLHFEVHVEYFVHLEQRSLELGLPQETRIHLLVVLHKLYDAVLQFIARQQLVVHRHVQSLSAHLVSLPIPFELTLYFIFVVHLEYA